MPPDEKVLKFCHYSTLVFEQFEEQPFVSANASRKL